MTGSGSARNELHLGVGRIPQGTLGALVLEITLEDEQVLRR